MQDPFESITFGNSLLLRVDGAIGAMSLSPNGRDAVLAGRRGLFIIDLDDPFTTPRWLHHITSWEVADVQWSPHHFAKPSWCISTSNQKALLWDLSRPSDSSILNVLHQHTRAITDINFHPLDPEILATCSIDTYILSWDMRTPRKAVDQWAEWRAGATQVKWNHHNPYEIASSHDHSFYIWDTRKGALPVLRVEDAHHGKINGIDFSHGLDQVITCSNDGTIKYWDLTTSAARHTIDSFNYFDRARGNTIDPSIIINTDFPVARARHLPFGSEDACGVMPLRGGQDSVHILNVNAALDQYRTTHHTQVLDFEPVHLFKGHQGPIKDFLWRKRHGNYEDCATTRDWTDYQLVTWSLADYDLKLWPNEDEVYQKVNYNPLHQKVLKSVPIDTYDTGTTVSSASTSPNSTVSGTDRGGERGGFGTNGFGASSYGTNGANGATLGGSDGTMPHGYLYNSYAIEPPVNLTNIITKNHGDILLSMAMFQIAKKHKNLTILPTQLNHLDWISGVRIGTANDTEDRLTDNPTNLGEEVSMVAHTFPKVRFEKISVSTGELILSLQGPVPVAVQTTAAKAQTATKVAAKIVATAKATTGKLDGVPSPNPQEDDKPEDTQTAIDETKPTDEDDTEEQKLIFIRLQINFPRAYPFLDPRASATALKKSLRQNFISFEIEETHELTKEVREEFLANLKEISQFYANRHQRFCLEPLLRYLMGDKIVLDDNLVAVETPMEEDDVEVGEEGWADDLINQQPGSPLTSPPSGPTSPDDEGYESPDSESLDGEFSDFMPALNDEEMINSTGSLGRALATDAPVVVDNSRFFDSTPIPKGCGAMWSRTGQLVCFFIPKNTEEEDNKALQKFSIFKFTDAGFSLTQGGQHDHSHETSHAVSHHSHHSDSDYSEESDDNASTTSSDSFTNDWDDIEEEDLTSRFRVPGLFKTSVGLGNRYVSRATNRMKTVTSGGGTGSNYKSSLPGALVDLKKKKKAERNHKNKNIVGIFDFKHLLPDKEELAREYRVLGDSPENLARYNSSVALKYGLNDIANAWKLLEMVLVKDIQINDIHPVYYSSNVLPNTTVARNVEAMNHLLKVSHMTKKLFNGLNYRFYWGAHPFGYAWLVEEMMNYFERKGNLQMLVMMLCILFENDEPGPATQGVTTYPATHAPYQGSASYGSTLFGSTPYGSSPHYHHRPLATPLHESSFHESFSTDARSVDMRTILPSSGHPSQAHLSPAHRTSSMITRRESMTFSSSLGIAGLGAMGSGAMGGGTGMNAMGSIPYARSITSLSDDSPDKPRKSLDERLRKHATATARKPRPTPKRPPRKGGVKPPPEISIHYENVASLDLFDDIYTKPLLSSQDSGKIEAYRESYANMLYAWGLPANRIKILKFNYPNFSQEFTPSKFVEHECNFGYRPQAIDLALEVKYVNQPTSIESAKGNVWLGEDHGLKYCVLCNLLVSKRLVICTNCEHVMHSDCALEWWSGEDECGSGCGCECLNYRL